MEVRQQDGVMTQSGFAFGREDVVCYVLRSLQDRIRMLRDKHASSLYPCTYGPMAGL